MQIFVTEWHASFIWIFSNPDGPLAYSILWYYLCGVDNTDAVKFYLAWIYGIAVVWTDAGKSNVTLGPVSSRDLCLLGELFVPWTPLSLKMLRALKLSGIQAPLTQQMLKTLKAADGKVLCNTDSSVLFVLHLFERYFLTALDLTVLVRLQNFGNQ